MKHNPRWVLKTQCVNLKIFTHLKPSFKWHLCNLRHIGIFYFYFFHCRVGKYFSNRSDVSSALFSSDTVPHRHVLFISGLGLNTHLSEDDSDTSLKSILQILLQKCFLCTNTLWVLLYWPFHHIEMFKLLCKHSISQSDVWLSPLKIPKCSSPVLLGNQVTDAQTILFRLIGVRQQYFIWNDQLHIKLICF